MTWKILEGFSVLLYGALTLILLFIFALWHGSFYAAAVCILATGCTYIFQVLLVENSDPDGAVPQETSAMFNATFAFIMGLVALAFVLAIFGV